MLRYWLSTALILILSQCTRWSPAKTCSLDSSARQLGKFNVMRLSPLAIRARWLIWKTLTQNCQKAKKWRGRDTKPRTPLPSHCHEGWSLECLRNVCQGEAAVPCRLISFCRSSSIASSSAISSGVSPSLFTTPTFAPWLIRYLQRHKMFSTIIQTLEFLKEWSSNETSTVQVVICILIKIQWSGPPLLLLVNCGFMSPPWELRRSGCRLSERVFQHWPWHDQHVALNNPSAHVSDSRTAALGNNSAQTCPYYSLDHKHKAAQLVVSYNKSNAVAKLRLAASIGSGRVFEKQVVFLLAMAMLRWDYLRGTTYVKHKHAGRSVLYWERA